MLNSVCLYYLVFSVYFYDFVHFLRVKPKPTDREALPGTGGDVKVSPPVISNIKNHRLTIPAGGAFSLDI